MHLKMNFGLTSAPATFSRVLHAVFKDMKDTCLPLYQDDLNVPSHTFADHISHVDEVLRRLRGSGLKLKPSKCM
jgi:Reverse transcriptase (RNA-dependent DNA polymerase)